MKNRKTAILAAAAVLTGSLMACAKELPSAETVVQGSSAVQTQEDLTQADSREDAGEQSLIRLTLEEYPRVDGSLACVPLMESLVRQVTGCTQAEAEVNVENWFTNTNPCYLELAKGERDLLLAYEPSGETLSELEDKEQYPHEPQKEAVGKDALVFIVNRDNPVESLTKEQLEGIYTGKITNWKEVGGEDSEIRVFTRPENSGSQTLMRKLLLGDTPMLENPTEQVPGMEGIITALLDYTNEANAIGYSVYYYASMMYEQPDLKFLAVEGTVPESGTIRKDEYPLVNPFYCVTSDASSAEALQIRDWLLTDEGQALVEECGYVPIR